MKNLFILFFFVFLVIVSNANAGYILEFETPTGVSLNGIYWGAYNKSIQNFDMDNNGIPELTLSINDTLLVYNTSSYELIWSYAFSGNGVLLGFFDIDADDVREAVIRDSYSPNESWIDVINWQTDEIEFSLENLSDFGTCDCLDIDGDTFPEIIAQIGSWPDLHLEIWGAGQSNFISDSDFSNGLPRIPKLSQNYPNPFNPNTQILFELPEKTKIKLIIYDSTGKLIKTLVEGEREAGRYNLIWNGTDENNQTVGSGMYFYQLESNGKKETKKSILIR